jgi:hypothetical protein
MNQIFLSHSVSEFAALVQALIAPGSPELHEPLSILGTQLTGLSLFSQSHSIQPIPPFADFHGYSFRFRIP